MKLIVGAGKASPSPPVGPALGSKGVKSMDFCKVEQCSDPMLKPHTNKFSRSSMQGQLTSILVSPFQLESLSVLIEPFHSS